MAARLTSVSLRSRIKHRLNVPPPLFLALRLCYTTREPREGEKDGDDYYFVKNDEFDARLLRCEFVQTCR